MVHVGRTNVAVRLAFSTYFAEAEDHCCWSSPQFGHCEMPEEKAQEGPRMLPCGQVRLGVDLSGLKANGTRPVLNEGGPKKRHPPRKKGTHPLC